LTSALAEQQLGGELVEPFVPVPACREHVALGRRGSFAVNAPSLNAGFEKRFVVAIGPSCP
jgi:hypothetical protein